MPLNLPEKEDAMGDPFHIIIFFQAKGMERAKINPCAKIGIKNGIE